MKKRIICFTCDECGEKAQKEQEENLNTNTDEMYPFELGWVRLENKELFFKNGSEERNINVKGLDFCSKKCYLDNTIKKLGINKVINFSEKPSINDVSNPNTENYFPKKQSNKDVYSGGFDDPFNQPRYNQPTSQPKEYQEPKKKGFFGFGKK